MVLELLETLRACCLYAGTLAFVAWHWLADRYGEKCHLLNLFITARCCEGETPDDQEQMPFSYLYEYRQVTRPRPHQTTGLQHRCGDAIGSLFPRGPRFCVCYHAQPLPPPRHAGFTSHFYIYIIMSTSTATSAHATWARLLTAVRQLPQFSLCIVGSSIVLFTTLLHMVVWQDGT
jgi:hypothetical protein